MLRQAAEAERRERDEREAAARKRAGREAEEADKRRRRAAHADAVAAFRALLGEMVKDPDAAWSAWRPRLQRDPQARPHPSAHLQELWCLLWCTSSGACHASVPRSPAHTMHRMQGRASNPALDDRECVALFREHVDEMHKRAVASFTDLLDKARAALAWLTHAGPYQLNTCVV